MFVLMSPVDLRHGGVGCGRECRYALEVRVRFR